MDLHANYAEQVRLAWTILDDDKNGHDCSPDDASRLAELVIALYDFRMAGGGVEFLPVTLA